MQDSNNSAPGTRDDDAELIRAILETALDGIIAVDEQGVIQTVNPAVERVFGYTAAETIGQNISMLMPEPFRSEHDGYIARYLATREPRIIGIGREVPARRKDGTIVPVHLSVSEAFYRGKRIFVGVMHDLSAQREVEEQRDRFFNATSDLLCTIGADGHFGLLNPAWLRVLGYTPGELRALPVKSFLHPQDPPLGITLDGWDGEEGTAPIETRMRCKDGSYKWLEWLVVPARADGVLFAAARDVTERKEVDRLKSEFVSTVSHELRTPLTSIRGSLGLLESGSSAISAAQHVELIRIARENTDRLIRLINDVLDLEKIESGKLELDHSKLVPANLVTEAVNNVSAVAAQHKVEIALELEDRGTVHGDHDRIVQVLVNLLGNAIKFSPAQSTVTVSVRTHHDRVRFAVRDQGPGIPVTHHARLFNRFEQMDGSDRRAKGGTGLGLAICKAIVEQHGGTIGVHSEPGAGSEFFFTLGATEATRASAPPLAEIPTERRRLLVIEDDPDVAQVLRTLLKAEGYGVSTAGTMAGAKEVLAQTDVDVILLDIGLPDGNGVDLWAWLRGQARTASIPVVVVSGRFNEDNAESMGGPLLANWLVKPFSSDALLQSIRRAVHEPGTPALVLLVEDDVSTREVISAQLRRLGAECVDAGSGSEAIEALRDRCPDLIILDVNIHDIDGFELVERFRKGRARTTPLVVYTSRDLSALEKRQLTLGLTKHLTKCRSSQEEFVGAVRDLLAGLLP